MRSACKPKASARAASAPSPRENPLEISSFAFRVSESGLGLRGVVCGGGVFCGVDELADFGALLLNIGEVLFADFLVHLQLFLGALFVPGVHVGLAEAI